MLNINWKLANGAWYATDNRGILRSSLWLRNIVILKVLRYQGRFIVALFSIGAEQNRTPAYTLRRHLVHPPSTTWYQWNISTYCRVATPIKSCSNYSPIRAPPPTVASPIIAYRLAFTILCLDLLAFCSALKLKGMQSLSFPNKWSRYPKYKVDKQVTPMISSFRPIYGNSALNYSWQSSASALLLAHW